MTQVPCVICTALTRKPNMLCGSSVEVLRDALRDLPMFAHQLTITIAKQSRTGPGGGGGRSIGFADVALPINLAAADVLQSLRVRVQNACHRHRGEEAGRSLLGNVQWLTANLGTIRVSPWAATTWQEITDARAAAIHTIDRPPETWYAGICNNCQHDLYANVGAASVRCRNCRTSYNAQDRRTELVAAARDFRGTASYLAAALAPLLGRHVDPGRLHTLASRGKLHPVGADSKGRPLYTVGDVIDLLSRPESLRHERPATRR